MNAKIKQYNSLDLMKFISAILIIVLHTSPFQSYNALISFGLRNVVTIIAVPFFFCTSDFCFLKSSLCFHKMKRVNILSIILKGFALCTAFGHWSIFRL